MRLVLLSIEDAVSRILSDETLPVCPPPKLEGDGTLYVGALLTDLPPTGVSTVHYAIYRESAATSPQIVMADDNGDGIVDFTPGSLGIDPGATYWAEARYVTPSGVPGPWSERAELTRPE